MPHTTPLGLAPIRALDVEAVEVIAVVVAGTLFSILFTSAKPGSNGLALLAASVAVVVPSVLADDVDPTMVVCGVVDAVPEWAFAASATSKAARLLAGTDGTEAGCDSSDWTCAEPLAEWPGCD